MAIGVKDMIEEARGQVEEISPAEVKEGIDRGEVDLLVDVREPDEYREGHIPGAINVPRGVLEPKADPTHPSANPALTTKPDARIVLYCFKAPGFRSLTSAATLRRMGYENVVAMPAGVEGWSGEGHPVES